MRLNSPVAWLLLAALVGLAWRHGLPGSGNAPINPPIAVPTAAAARTAGPALPAFLPPEARATVALIQRGGPFPHPQDGSVFGNYEGHLPRQPRGWYHEYTVPTPGARNRGTRRIVTGGTPPREWYYTDNHYASFRRFDVP